MEQRSFRPPYFHKFRRPSGPCSIDFRHPIAFGLLRAVVNFEGGGGFSEDLLGRRRWTHNNTPVWAPYHGIDFPNGGTAFIDLAEADADYLGNVTIFWYGSVRTGGNFRHFAGKHAGNGATQNPFDFRTDNGATPFLRVLRSNTGTRDWSGQQVTLGSKSTYAVNLPTPIETTPRFFKDGVGTNGTAQGGAGTGAPTGSGANIRVGRRADGVVQMEGTMECVFFWKRLLSDAEHAELFRNPYLFVLPEQAVLPWLVHQGFPEIQAQPPAVAVPADCGHPMLHDCPPWYQKADLEKLLTRD